MCLAVTLKIQTVEGNTAVGESGGMTQKIRVDFIPDVRPGDYVMVHAGFAIQKMSEEEARENLRLLEEIRDVV
ncbi:MAG: HypC/HybG/HupF family hydrogenase formation chaperone [Ruminococcus sp.]|jgi:hydrogenase expression/formation protein HypC